MHCLQVKAGEDDADRAAHVKETRGRRLGLGTFRQDPNTHNHMPHLLRGFASTSILHRSPTPHTMAHDSSRDCGRCKDLRDKAIRNGKPLPPDCDKDSVPPGERCTLCEEHASVVGQHVECQPATKKRHVVNNAANNSGRRNDTAGTPNNSQRHARQGHGTSRQPNPPPQRQQQQGYQFMPGTMPFYPFMPSYTAYGHPFQPQLPPNGNHINSQSGIIGIHAGNHAPAQQQYGGFGLQGVIPGYEFGRGYGAIPQPFLLQLPPNLNHWPGVYYPPPQQPDNSQAQMSRPAQQEPEAEDRTSRQPQEDGDRVRRLEAEVKRLQEALEPRDDSGPSRKRQRAASPASSTHPPPSPVQPSSVHSLRQVVEDFDRQDAERSMQQSQLSAARVYASNSERDTSTQSRARAVLPGASLDPRLARGNHLGGRPVTSASPSEPTTQESARPASTQHLQDLSRTDSRGLARDQQTTIAERSRDAISRDPRRHRRDLAR